MTILLTYKTSLFALEYVVKYLMDGCEYLLYVSMIFFDIKFIFTVGEPIEVVANPNPSREDVQELHGKYVKALQTLFESHKKEYGIPDVKHLKFI